MLQIIKDISRSYLQIIVYYLGLYDKDMQAVVEQRTKACESCPLFSNGWCSKKKQVSTIDYPHYHIFRKVDTKVITGCGCWIFAKRFSVSSKCPLNRWKKFKL